MKNPLCAAVPQSTGVFLWCSLRGMCLLTAAGAAGQVRPQLTCGMVGVVANKPPWRVTPVMANDGHAVIHQEAWGSVRAQVHGC